MATGNGGRKRALCTVNTPHLKQMEEFVQERDKEKVELHRAHP